MEMKRLGVRVFTGVYVDSIERVQDGFLIRCRGGETRYSKRAILASGGAAQPRLGGNTDAFAWLEALGHSIIPPEPSLTPLRADKRSVSGLEGLRVKCRVTMRTDGAEVHEETGELLFSENGISGICVMQCSRFVIPGKSECLINLVYDLFSDAELLFEELKRRREAYTQDEPIGLLRGICAPKIAYAVCKQAGIPLRGETAGELQDAQLRKIAEKTCGYRVRILDREGFDRAQVMAGGVRCDEFDPETMESRLCPGLHAAGELLNVDGDCGGFNLMFACLSGIRAGGNERPS